MSNTGLSKEAGNRSATKQFGSATKQFAVACTLPANRVALLRKSKETTRGLVTSLYGAVRARAGRRSGRSCAAAPARASCARLRRVRTARPATASAARSFPRASAGEAPRRRSQPCGRAGLHDRGHRARDQRICDPRSSRPCQIPGSNRAAGPTARSRNGAISARGGSIRAGGRSITARRPRSSQTVDPRPDSPSGSRPDRRHCAHPRGDALRSPVQWIRRDTDPVGGDRAHRQGRDDRPSKPLGGWARLMRPAFDDTTADAPAILR
jgi:hypothetical protein